VSKPRPLVPFDCRVFRVERVRRRSGMSGDTHDYFHIDASTWVNVLPITRAGEVVLVRQERHGAEAFTLELPGGIVDAGESPAEAALRELREETGYAGTLAEPLGWVHPNPALQANRCYSFVARDVELAGLQQLDGREEIEVVTLSYDALREAVRRGEVTHSLVVSAMYLFELHGR
jgi:ADP-ribose pyrophosphatase